MTTGTVLSDPTLVASTQFELMEQAWNCLLYTSDAADE